MTTQIRLLAHRSDLTATAPELVEMIRQGHQTASERIAREIIAALRPDAVVSAVYPVINGRSRLVVVVERGAFYDEFRTWKEAIFDVADDLDI